MEHGCSPVGTDGKGEPKSTLPLFEYVIVDPADEPVLYRMESTATDSFANAETATVTAHLEAS